MDEDEFFAGHPEAKVLHDRVREAVRTVGPAAVRVSVSRSQVGFSRTRPFAATWRPGRHLTGEAAPLVLTVFLRHRDASPRWKQVVEPRPGGSTHHLHPPPRAALARGGGRRGVRLARGGVAGGRRGRPPPRAARPAARS